jgi:hypothetical protein
MPVKRQLIPTSWEQSVMQKLGDIGRRLQALERKKGVAQLRQVFLFFSQDGSLPFTWQDWSTGWTVGSFYQDDGGSASVTFTLNGGNVTPPFDMANGDKVVVTAAGVVNPGLGVTLIETL